jgi:hypothetical protein
MFLVAERWEMYTRAKDFRFGQDAHATDAIEVHLRVGVAIGVAQVGEMRTPRSEFRIPFDDHSVLVERFGKLERSL